MTQQLINLPQGVTFGSNTGNAVLFSGMLVNLYPKEEGYYGIITDCTPAANYNQEARYAVDVFKDGKYQTNLATVWGNITDKF